MSETADTPRVPSDNVAPSDVASAPTAWRPRANPWLIAVVVALGAFMEVLDTSIANVALPYMAGNLGASSDQSTWVLTSYLVSNAIVLPIAGWFVSVLGRKRFFLICLATFTLSSLLCGIAPSLATLIVCRVLQGAGGGGLQPMAQAILADTFSPRQRGLAFALYGITVVAAPVLGPTIGGWITDNYSWRWIFLINLPVGIVASLLVARLVEDPPWERHRVRGGLRIDYIGVALLVLGVGALQIMLDKGQELDWFGSSFIVACAVIAVVGLSTLVMWEWFHDDPIVDIRLFAQFNFLSANVMMFVAGITMFSSLVLMPQFLQLLLGYSSESAGLVLSTGGLLLVVLMPIAGTLTSKVPARNIIAIGWIITAAAMFYSARKMSLGIDFREASLLRVLQVASLPLLFVPILTVSYLGLPREKSNNVAGLVNFARNIGSSFGTSLVTALVARQAQFHQVHLVAHVTPGEPPLMRTAAALSARLVRAGVEPSLAAHQAYGRVYRGVIVQATALAYIDVYWLLAIGAAVMVPLCVLLRRNTPGGGPVMAE
jgi:MFS transporter, DHA2 family, multidrug resistance protein